MNKKNKKRTKNINPTKNISFPIGTIAAVQECFDKLGFSGIFGKYKKKGRDITALVQALVSYKLTDNLSVSKASNWINRVDVLELYELCSFEERTLFRCLQILGENHEEIISDIQDCLFNTYNFEHTDTVFDWTSLVLHGEKCKMGKHGYSRDHRPDKKQITLGVAELAKPINIPIGLTIKDGNVNDMKHFEDTYDQVKGKLVQGSLLTFDKGAHSKKNVALVEKDKMKYLTAKKLNKSDDKRIAAFDKNKAECIDPVQGVYGIKYEKPSKIDYFFFSEKSKQEQIESKKRKAMKKFAEAKEIQTCLDKKKQLPMKYRIKNELVDVTYLYQTKLKDLGEEEAKKYIERVSLNGREGFFCISSTKNLTLQQALETYRQKDSIEKIFDSLKNEIDIKPLRVWSDEGIKGVLIIGFLAQLVVSLARYEHTTIKHVSTKFIRKSLMSLTVTVEYHESGSKRHIFSNFDAINCTILGKNQAIT
jgi:transposase